MRTTSALRSATAIAAGITVVLVLLAILTRLVGADSARGTAGTAGSGAPAAVVWSLLAAALAGLAGGYATVSLTSADRPWHAGVVAALVLGLGIGELLRAGGIRSADGLSLARALAPGAGVLAGVLAGALAGALLRRGR